MVRGAGAVRGGEGKIEKPIPATEACPLCGPLCLSCLSVTHQREMKGRQTSAVTLSPGGGSCGGDWGVGGLLDPLKKHQGIEG